MAKKLGNTNRSVKISHLTLDWDSVNWDGFNAQFHIVRYELPGYLKNESSYFGKVHNWAKNNCDKPYYLHSHSLMLYVLYDSPSSVVDLCYEKLPLPKSVIIPKNESEFHAIFKVLVSQYFMAHEKFVSNAHFYLRVPLKESDYVTVLDININQDWLHNRFCDFIVFEEATRLRKLDQTERQEIQKWSEIYYGRSYKGATAYFMQIKRSEISEHIQTEDIFKEYRNKQFRAQVPFHSLKSRQALEKTRSYLLNEFLTNLIAYLHEIGLPYQYKEFRMEKVDTKTGNRMKTSQIPKRQRVIYAVDDRAKALIQQDNFVEEFCNFASARFAGDLISFTPADLAALSPRDWVLRLQDYDVEDLAPDSILCNYQDTKHAFYRDNRDVVKQTLNINPNTDIYRDDMKKKEQDRRKWSSEEYLDYDFDQVISSDEKKAHLLRRLEVCFNQLFLKDIIMFPEDVSNRLPILSLLSGKVFIAYGAMMYFDGSSLVFSKISGEEQDVERAENLILALTGKDLTSDILDPSREYNYYKPDAKKRFEDVRKRKFIVSPDFTLEITDAKFRMFYENRVIRDRLDRVEKKVEISCFYPRFPVSGNAPFTEAQLRDFDAFLKEYVTEPFISYKDLKARYGMKVKNSAGEEIQDGGFYKLLGLTKSDKKLKEYFRNHLNLEIYGVRDKSLIPIYQGIWYEPNYRYYLVGSKDTMSLEQERAFIFREIECHHNNLDNAAFYTLLRNEFFPLLEVNFIRHNSYTVYPFPFKLIQIWQDLERLSQE